MRDKDILTDGNMFTTSGSDWDIHWTLFFSMDIYAKLITLTWF